jgi:hypothetical protein
MPLALVLYVIDDPRQIARAETDNAIAGLPVESLVAEFLIGFVRRRALQLADPFADRQRGRDADAQMHMRLNTADLMAKDSGRVDTAAAKVRMNDGLDLRR